VQAVVSQSSKCQCMSGDAMTHESSLAKMSNMVSAPSQGAKLCRCCWQVVGAMNKTRMGG
jgi:hypothetical protein